MSRTIRSNSNITINCKYHVVFCPKYRKKVLVNPVDIRLKELLVEKSEELQADILEMEIMPDYCHLLLSCDPQYGIHKIVKQLKGYSSHILRSEFSHLKSRLPSLWTNSYFVATVGSVTLEVVKQYVLSQKERGG